MSAGETPRGPYVPPAVQDDVPPGDSREPPGTERADEGSTARAADSPGGTAHEENTETKAPIRLKDALRRMFTLPWHLARTWKGMIDLINEAFESIPVIRDQVLRGQYDLMSPDGEIILPTTWDHVVQPGWQVTMLMWPIVDEPRESPRPGLQSYLKRTPSDLPAPESRLYHPRRTTSPARRPESPPPPRPPSTGRATDFAWIHKPDKASKKESPAFFTGLGRRSRLIKYMGLRKGGKRGGVNLQLGLHRGKLWRRRPASVSSSSSSSPSSKYFTPSGTGPSTANCNSLEAESQVSETVRRPFGYDDEVEKRLVVVCKVYDRLIRRPTQLPNSTGRRALPPPERLVIASARTCWEGPTKVGLAALELIAQKRKSPSPIEQAGPSAEGDHATWLHVRRSVMSFHEFEDIAQFDLAKDRTTSSVISHLLRTIRAEKLDDDWYIKPGTILRCDTKAGESPAASVIFVSVPYLCPSSFKSSSGTEKAEGTCAPRRLHEAFSFLSASADRDRGQEFRRNEGRAADQVLWVRQVWMLITESGILTYGDISRRDLEGGSIAVREPARLDEEGDMVVQLVDEDRKLYYTLLSKCKSFYELQIEVRNQLSRAGRDVDGADIQLEVSEEEPLTAGKWSSLLKQTDIPLIKVSVHWPSSDSDTSSGAESSSDDGGQEPHWSGSLSALEEDNKPASRSRNSSSISGGSSRRARTSSSKMDRVAFLVVPGPEEKAETKDSVPKVPQMNRKVPPFLAWSSTDKSRTVSEVFKEGVGLTEAALLHLDKFQRSRKPLRELYNAFDNENIYEGMRECSPEDFAHRRRALGGANGSGSGVLVTALPFPAGQSNARIEEFLDRCIPVFESFVSPGLPSSLTSKFFGALFMITEDPTRKILDYNPADEASDPDIDAHANDDGGTRHGWVISRKEVTQRGLRPIIPARGGQYRCGDCERGLIYPNLDKATAHLRKKHLVVSRPDEDLWKCLLSEADANAEWLESEIDAILSASRDTMGSILRKLASIQDGVLFEGEFRAPEQGLPYALLDAFKLIVAFVCAVAQLVHDVHWFYRDSAHGRRTRDLTSRSHRVKKKALLNVGEAAGDLITKTDRALVSTTDEAACDGPENFMTSVGMHYVGLQIICNIFQMPIHNKKKAASLYEAYAKNLRSTIIRNPQKRQVPVIGALAEELNLLREFNDWQTAPLRSLGTLLQPGTYRRDLRRASDRDKLSGLEAELIVRQTRELDRDARHLSQVLDLCSRLTQQVRELTEIMEGDQSRAVVVFTVVTVIFLPLSFVASYIGMGGGVEGLGMSWVDIQALFWAVAGPLTAGVVILCLALTGRRSLGRMMSAVSVPLWMWWPWSGSREKRDPPERERAAVGWQAYLDSE